MRTPCIIAVLAAGFASAAVAAEPPHGRYAGQHAREIKALDPEFVDGLKRGAGLGFAKAAELNGYPGPAHLLELADRIPLSADQTDAIRAIFDRMQRDAITLGAALLTAEREIETAFRHGGLTSDRLDDLTAAAGAASARLRARHLSAHLAAAETLLPEQIAAYNRLRGYGAPHGQHRKH